MTKAPTLFKMDVEHFEFEAMAHILDKAVMYSVAYLLLSHVLVDLHYDTRIFDSHSCGP